MVSEEDCPVQECQRAELPHEVSVRRVYTYRLLWRQGVLGRGGCYGDKECWGLLWRQGVCVGGSYGDKSTSVGSIWRQGLLNCKGVTVLASSQCTLNKLVWLYGGVTLWEGTLEHYMLHCVVPPLETKASKLICIFEHPFTSLVTTECHNWLP